MDNRTAIKIKSGLVLDIVSDTIYNNIETMKHQDKLDIPISINTLETNKNISIEQNDVKLLMDWFSNVLIEIDNKYYVVNNINNVDNNLIVSCCKSGKAVKDGYVVIKHIRG